MLEVIENYVNATKSIFPVHIVIFPLVSTGCIVIGGQKFVPRIYKLKTNNICSSTLADLAIWV